jgi:Flp pilus assembly protein TadG
MLLLKRFQRDESASTAIIFGLALIPVMAAMGAALDYTRAATVRTALQAAVDAAALAAAKDTARSGDRQTAERARAVFGANFNRKDSSQPAVAVQRNDKTIRVTARAEVKTSIMSIMHIETIPVSATGEVAWGRNKIELALVLDNTGSMSTSGKMPALKDAVRDFLSTLEAASDDRDSVKVSIVPFDTQVNIGTGFRNADWLTFDADLDRNRRVERRDWQGCVVDRTQPYDIDDAAGRGNAALYPAARCGTGSLAELQPLTSDFGALRRTTQRMNPSGMTNLTIGIAWGLSTLNPAEPLGEAKAFGTAQLDKVMIVLTDGDNTQNRYTEDSGAIDARTRLACQAVKDRKVKLYTIRVIEGNRRLLRECASETNMYYEVSNANDIAPIFQRIADEITTIRLTH